MRSTARRAARAASTALVALALLAGCEPWPVVPDPPYEPDQVQVPDPQGRPPRALLFGDSNMDVHGSAARVALREAGVDVTLYGAWSAHLFTRAQYDYGRTNPAPPAGEVLAEASRLVTEVDPDVVAVYINHNYWPSKNPAEDPSLPAGYPRDAAGNPIDRGTPAFTAMAQAQITALVARLRAGGAEVLLVEPASPGPGLTSADNEIWQAYLGVRAELGFGVVPAGDIVNAADGTWVDAKTGCSHTSMPVRPPGDAIHFSYFGAGLAGTVTARAVAAEVGLDLRGVTAPTDTPAALVPDGTGYRLVTCDGAAFRFGTSSTTFGGVALGARANGDAVVDAARAAGGGWWQVTASGRVFALGGAPTLGSAPAGADVVAIASTPTGGGYWLLRNTGEVLAFGNAAALGGATLPPGVLATDLAVAPGGTGYWILGSTGVVVRRGTAAAHGDLGLSGLLVPAVALAPRPTGDGYWILDQTGAVHAFGAAPWLGSAANVDYLRSNGLFTTPYSVPASQYPTTAVDLKASPSGAGYWVALANGAVCHFGDAPSRSGIMPATVNSWQVYVGLQYPYYPPTGDCSQQPAS